MISFGSMPKPKMITIGAAIATTGTAWEVMSAGKTSRCTGLNVDIRIASTKPTIAPMKNPSTVSLIVCQVSGRRVCQLSTTCDTADCGVGST